MQIINYVRASLFNNSYSAFKIACAAQKDFNFALGVISAKSNDAHVRLEKLKKDSKDSIEYDLTELESKKYDSFLNRIASIQKPEKAVTSSN